MILPLLAAAAAQVVAPPAPPASPPPPIEGEVRASARLGDGSGAAIDLVVLNDTAVLRGRGGRWNGAVAPLASPDLALMVLADRRMAPLWPALLDWAGPGLEKLRFRQLGFARLLASGGATRVAATTAASSTRPKVRAVLLVADAQAAAGQLNEAIATVSATRAAANLKSDWDHAEFMALSVRLATLTRLRDGTPAALAVLDAAEARLGEANPYAINFRINRAAYLAESGQPQRALDALDQAETPFRARREGGYAQGGEKVPGSDRQFAWIRICALTQLGRSAEAQPLLAALYPPREPNDLAFYVPGSETVRYRLFRCTGDAAAAARELAGEMEKTPLGGVAFLHLQPAYRIEGFDPALKARIAAERAMVQALAGRFRVLPPALTAALNRWRAEAPVTS